MNKNTLDTLIFLFCTFNDGGSFGLGELNSYCNFTDEQSKTALQDLQNRFIIFHTIDSPLLNDVTFFFLKDRNSLTNLLLQEFNKGVEKTDE